MSTIELGARVLLAAVLALAVLGKLRTGSGFVRVLPGVPERAATPLAVVVTGAEAAVAVLLLVPATARLGAVAAIGLFGAFTGVVALLVKRRSRERCLCFGATGAAFSRRHVVRNATLTALAVLVAAVPGASPPPEPAATALAVAVGSVLALLVSRLDDLIALFTSTTVATPTR